MREELGVSPERGLIAGLVMGTPKKRKAPKLQA
jgi:hypothetical protein